MKRSLFSIAGILILSCILLFINGIASFSFGRFKLDLTEEKLFSLSAGTKNILSKLEDEVTLRFYASKPEDVHPAIKVYAQRIEDLLKEYQRYGGEKLKLEIYNPEPDTDAEDWAKKYGLTPFALPGKTPVFLGLVGSNGLGEEDLIAFFQPDRQQFLEYDLTKLIYNLARTNKPKIGLISSVDLSGDKPKPPQFPGQPPQAPESQPWYFVKQLESLAEVVILKNDLEKIDEDISLLMLVHPPVFDEKTRYAIDQFVVRGGNLFVAVDQNCQSCVPAQSFPQMQDMASEVSAQSSTDALLEKWGLSLNPGKVVGNRDLAAKVGVGQGQIKEFLLWLAFSKNNSAKNSMNAEDIVTSELDSLIMPWAGDLVLKDVEGVKSQILIRTTANSKLYDSQEFNSINLDPDVILKGFASENTEHVIAARLSGKFKSNFTKAVEGSPVPYKESSKQEANIVVVSDVDFISDTYSIAKQQFFNTEIVSLLNDNILLLQNIVENLLGSNDLISLRSRGTFSRPFARVEEIERKAQERWLDEEQALQDELGKINARLSQLLAAQDGEQGKQTIVNQAVLDEIKQFREQQKEAKTRLREVRRKSRQDIENMENRLFLINTFLIPLILVLSSVVFIQLKKRRARK